MPLLRACLTVGRGVGGGCDFVAKVGKNKCAIPFNEYQLSSSPDFACNQKYL